MIGQVDGRQKCHSQTGKKLESQDRQIIVFQCWITSCVLQIEENVGEARTLNNNYLRPYELKHRWI